MKANLLKSMSREAREVLLSKFNPENDYICQALKKAQEEFDNKLNQAAEPQMLAKRKNLILNFLGFFN